MQAADRIVLPSAPHCRLSFSYVILKRDRVPQINDLRYANDTTLMAESEEELKSLLMNVKGESEKVSLKLNIQKTKIMASGPITSWQRWGNSGWLYFLGFQNHCRWWVQPWNQKTLTPWKESYVAGITKNQDTLGWNICDQGKGTHVWLRSLPDPEKKKWMLMVQW